MLIAIALVGRASWLQVVQHAHYVELSQGNRARIEPLPPTRGIIYARGGRVIAEGTPEEVSAVPASFTGQFLRALLAPPAARAKAAVG